MKSGAGNSGADKSHMERGDLSKIVITRNRSGRIIRCKDDDDLGDEPGRGENYWKRPYDDDNRGRDSRRARDEPEIPNTRRVFTPPRNAREGEHGSLTVYDNENDLPMTSKSLQERVQARLRAIERRHQVEEGNPAAADNINGGAPDKPREGSFPNEEFPPNESPRGSQSHWRSSGGGGSSFDRRSGSSFNRPDHFGSRGGGGGSYFGRARPRGGPRWRGQWDDYRGRRGNWGHRYDDRRRDSGPSGGGGGGSGAQGGSFERRRRRFVKSGSGDRSPRSSRSHSRSRSRSRPSRSRSRSISRSASSSPSPSPMRPHPRMRVISRARIKTPTLAPLVTNMKRSDSDENLAELDQFVAQLKAKRQLQQQYQQQQQYMAQYQEMQATYVTATPTVQPQESNPNRDNRQEIGPQMPMQLCQHPHNDDSYEEKNEPNRYDDDDQQQQHQSYTGDDYTAQEETADEHVGDAPSPEAPQAASPLDESMEADGMTTTELTAA